MSILSRRMKNKEERHKGRWWTFVNLVLTNTDAIRSSLCFRRDRFCFAILGAIEKPVSCRNNKLAFEYNKPCLHWDPPNPKHLKQLAKQEHTEENKKPAKSFRQNISLAGELHFYGRKCLFSDQLLFQSSSCWLFRCDWISSTDPYDFLIWHLQIFFQTDIHFSQ